MGACVSGTWIHLFWVVQDVTQALSDSGQPTWDFLPLLAGERVWAALTSLGQGGTAGNYLQLQNRGLSVRLEGTRHRMWKIGPCQGKGLDQGHIEQEERWPDVSLFLPPVGPSASRSAEKRAEWGWVGLRIRLWIICAFSQLALSQECMWWSSKTELFSLSAPGIWGQIIPCGELSCAFFMFSSIFGLCPLDASSTPPVV